MPLTAVTALIAVNQITGILSLVFGPLGDRWGYRVMLVSGMAMLAVGMLAGGIFPLYGVVLAALFLAGLGKSVFDPALQAYAGTRVPFHRRGMVIGTMETAWAGASLVGIPMMGLLMARSGWKAPFFVLGAVGILGGISLWKLMPGNSRGDGARNVQLLDSWLLLFRNRPAMGVLGCAFFLSMANDTFFVIYGAWLEDAFHLSVVVLGLATSVIGVAELVGEALTASVADRVGLHRSVVIGLVLSGLGYLVLPLVSPALPWALGCLFFVFLTVEFGIVSLLSLCTEVLPGARATMMSGYLAWASVGRVAGALLGGPVWLSGGITGTGMVSAAGTLAAGACLWWGLRGVEVGGRRND